MAGKCYQFVAKNLQFLKVDEERELNFVKGLYCSFVYKLLYLIIINTIKKKQLEMLSHVFYYYLAKGKYRALFYNLYSLFRVPILTEMTYSS